MRCGGTGEIDRVTTRGETNRQRPRLALAGGLSAVTRPFPLPSFPDRRKGKEGRAATGDGEGKRKETGGEGEDICMYMRGETGRKNVQVHQVQIDVSGSRGGTDGGRKKKRLSWMLNCTQT